MAQNTKQSEVLRKRGSVLERLFKQQQNPPTNLINDYSHGNQVQQSYYSGPANFLPAGAIQHPNWSPWPWNPVQAGDALIRDRYVLMHALVRRGYCPRSDVLRNVIVVTITFHEVDRYC